MFSIKNTFLKFKNSSVFLKNALTLISSTVVAQLIPIVTAPILTRIYSPEDYGILGIYMSISGLFSVFSTLGYANAVMIAKEDEDACTLVTICLYNSFLVSTLSLLLVAFCKDVIAHYFQLQKQSEIYLYFIPFTVLLNGVNITLSVWSNRKGMYNRLAFGRIVTSILTPIVSITLGLVYHTFSSLFFGLIVGQLISTLMLWIPSFKENKNLFKVLNFSLLKGNYLHHKNFLIYSLPTDFISNFTNQIPLLMFSNWAGTAVVGQYNMSNRMLGLPSSFISASVGEVFKQRATEDYHKTGTCRPLFVKTLKMLFCFALPIFSIIFLFGTNLFTIFLGDKWLQAGEFSQTLSILFFLRFFVSPLTYTIYLSSKQYIDLIGTLTYAVTSLFVIYYSINFLKVSITQTLIFYIMNAVWIYLVMFAISYKLSRTA